MSYGFKAVNELGQTIISSVTPSLYFSGYGRLINSTGLRYSDFPDYEGGTDESLDGHCIYTFISPTSSMPVSFIKPALVNNFHTIINQRLISGRWNIDVMVVGEDSANNPPLLLCFNSMADATRIPDVYGLLVRDERNKVTFDSRLRPLNIAGSAAINPPVSPMNSGIDELISDGYSWNYKTLDWDFGSDSTFSRKYWNSGVSTSNLMYSPSTVAQAVYKRQINGYKKSKGEYSSQEHWSTAMWWAMYRNAFRVSSNTIDSGWGVYTAGYTFSSRAESGGFAGGGGGSWSTGTMPYVQKTINLEQTASVIIADSSWYM